jgi:D-lactate dehydrogenase
VGELVTLEPSALEMVDKNLLDFVMHSNPARLKGLVAEPFPAVVVLAEFDDEHKQQHKAKKAKKILAKLSESFAVADSREERERLWSIRLSASEVATIHGDAEALPILANGTVPRDRLQELIEGLYALFAKHHLKIAIAGHAGIANLTVQPLLDLAKVSDRQKVFKLMDDYYDLVLNLGGDMNGDSGDGRLYGPYLPQAYGPELYQIFCDVKRILDPYGTLNPGVKVEVSKESIVPLLRKEYSAGSFYDRLPNF